MCEYNCMWSFMSLFKFGYRNSVILMIISYQDEISMSHAVCTYNELPRGSLHVVIAHHHFHSGNNIFENEYLKSPECLLKEQK